MNLKNIYIYVNIYPYITAITTLHIKGHGNVLRS